MRHVPITLVALLPFATFASAQTVAPSNPNHPAVVVQTRAAQASADIVVARLMTFDRDNDGLVAKDELPDRMRNLITGDGSGDGALDRDEIRAMAMVPRSVTATLGGHPGGYTFGDQFQLSSRSHVEGALDDLRLPDSTRDRALAIVTQFIDSLEARATETLLKDLTDLVTPNQLATMTTAVSRSLAARPMMVTSTDGTSVPPLFGAGPDLAFQINRFHLPPLQNGLATDAIKQFKDRLRPGDAERDALVAQLKGTLTDEERDDFRAALARRPFVKGSGFTLRDNIVVVSEGVVKDGVFRTPLAPEPRVLTP